MQIKRLLIKIMARALRRFTGFSVILAVRFGFAGRAFRGIGRFLFAYVFFPSYRAIFVLKFKARGIYAPAKSKVFFFLSKSYLVHVLIAFVGLGIVFNNIMAQDLREENFGEQTIIYAIVSREEIEELTEELPDFSAAEKILSYLGQGATLGPKPVSGTVGGIDIGLDFSTIIEGGAAVTRPGIISPFNPADVEQPVESARQGITVYTVQAGENLYAIAGKFNVSIETILWQNGLTARSVIRPGDKLEILPASGVVHKVVKNETVGSIAKKYKVDESAIIAANNLFDGHDIKIAQQLVIPGGRKIVPYVAPKVKNNVPQVSSITKLFIPPTGLISDGGMLWPAGVRRISQYFSWRHTGLDIAGPVGTPEYAAESGTVIFAGWATGYGNSILIDHGNGMRTRYGHASKLYVEKGDEVVKGQTIMAMGSTGWSTGPHLHFEVIVNGVKKNPLSYVK